MNLSDHLCNKRKSSYPSLYATQVPTNTLYLDPDKHTAQSFDTSTPALTLSCSAVATTTPSRTRVIVPRICAIPTRQKTSGSLPPDQTSPLTHPLPNRNQLRQNLHLLSLRHRIQIRHTKRPTHPHHLPEPLPPHKRYREGGADVENSGRGSTVEIAGRIAQRGRDLDADCDAGGWGVGCGDDCAGAQDGGVVVLGVGGGCEVGYDILGEFLGRGGRGRHFWR